MYSQLSPLYIVHCPDTYLLRIGMYSQLSPLYIVHCPGTYLLRIGMYSQLSPLYVVYCPGTYLLRIGMYSETLLHLCSWEIHLVNYVTVIDFFQEELTRIFPAIICFPG